MRCFLSNHNTHHQSVCFFPSKAVVLVLTARRGHVELPHCSHVLFMARRGVLLCFGVFCKPIDVAIVTNLESLEFLCLLTPDEGCNWPIWCLIDR